MQQKKNSKKKKKKKKKKIPKKKKLKKIKGFIYLQKNISLVKKSFPKINNKIAIEKIVRLVSLSRLVGIQLNNNPGILSSIDLSFENSALKNKLYKIMHNSCAGI